MSAHQLISFEDILEGVRRARSWLDGIGVRSTGDRLETIEATLSGVVEDLRVLSAERFVKQWDWTVKHDAYYALVDGAAFARICEQLSHLPSHRLPRGELKRALQGPLVATAENPNTTDPRNVFLELDVASKLMSAGVTVTGFDDVRFQFEGVDHVVQCKRPFLARSVKSNVESAWRQLDDRVPKESLGRAVIAIAIDKLMELDRQPPVKIQDQCELDALVIKMAQRFLREHEMAWQAVADSRLAAVMLVVRFICHTLPPVNTISAVNYEVLVTFPQSGTSDHSRFEKLGSLMRGEKP